MVNKYNFETETGKVLTRCETALKSHEEICGTIAGPNDKNFAEQLVERITGIAGCS